MTVNEMMTLLKGEKINTWFDLGLFIDQIKENHNKTPLRNYKSYDDFKQSITKGGMAFISFAYSIDGVTVECDKYVHAFTHILGEFDVHYIAGWFSETGNQYLQPNSKQFQLDELLSFDDWDLYQDFFYKKLERGSKDYNHLITSFWKQVLIIVEKLSAYIDQNDIRLLYLININSNPGNISQALALVLISEYMDIPVINNSHDFYWEGGNSEIDIIEQNLKPGPRDHFFKNYHLGEVFSLLEVLYPWDSRKWISVNINTTQSNELINVHGHNPANVLTIDTCVDVDKFKTELTDERRKEIFKQISYIFQDEKGHINTETVDTFPLNIYRTKLRPVIFSDSKQKVFSFEKDNIILLQPTRILKRKTIEVDFTLITKLLTDHEVIEYFESNGKAKAAVFPVPVCA